MAKLTGKKRDTHIVQMIEETRRYSQTKMEPDRMRWEVAQNMFKNKQDWGKTRDENPWMNKVFLPLFSSVVRQGAATAYNMIFSQANVLSLESEDGNEEFTRILEKMLRYEFSQMRFEQRFYEAMIVGSVYGVLPQKLAVRPRLVVKPEAIVERLNRQQQKEIDKIASKIDSGAGKGESDEATMRMALEEAAKRLGAGGIQRLKLGGKKLFELGFDYQIINPFNHFWEPNISCINDSMYDIEQSFTKFYQLHELFEDGRLDPRKKKEVLKGVNADGSMGNAGVTHSSTREGQDFSQRDQFEDTSSFFPDCESWEYFGPLLGRDGDILEENKHFIVVNRVVCKDRDNPYYTQESPYFTATFAKTPFKAVGAGVADPGIDQNLVMNDIFSLYMDLLKLAVLNPRVYDSSKIVDPSQLENGIEPNALIEGVGDASKIFSDLPTGVGVGSSVLQAIQFLQLSAEQGSAVDTQSTNPSSRARITAAEIQSNLARQGQSQTTLGAIIDNEVLIPLGEKTLAGLLQFGFEKENLHRLATRGVITEAEFDLIADLDQIERYNEITRNYKISVKGFRDILERDNRAQRITEFVTTTSQNPQMADDVDNKEVLRVLGEALDMETDKLIRQNTPQDTAREENRILADDKAVAPAQNEEHQLHLNIHYEQLMKNPNNATIMHIQAHMQWANQMGIQLQQPPPEAAQFLGMGPEQNQGAPMQ